MMQKQQEAEQFERKRVRVRRISTVGLHGLSRSSGSNIKGRDSAMKRRFQFAAVFAAVALLLSMAFMSVVAPVSAQDDSVTVQLEPEDDSGVSGTVVLTADGDQTILTVQLEGSEAGYEGHMFDSTCDNHQAATVFYPIEAVDDEGQSESTVDAPLSELTSGKFWIHMHRPAGERGVGVACGQVPAADGVGGPLPSTGVGSTGDEQSNTWLLLGLMATVAAFGGSMLLRTRRQN
jgi:LPXTG-motif cell wall-anchored protein